MSGTPRVRVGDTAAGLGDGSAVAEVEIVQLWSCSEIAPGRSSGCKYKAIADTASAAHPATACLGVGVAVAEVEIVQLWSCLEILKKDSAWSPKGLKTPLPVLVTAVVEVKIMRLWSCSEILEGDSARNLKGWGWGCKFEDVAKTRRSPALQSLPPPLVLETVQR